MSKSVPIRRELAYSKPAYQVHKMTIPAVIYISGTLFRVTHWPPSLSHDLSTVRAEHCGGPHPSTGRAGATTWPLFSPARSTRELFGGGGADLSGKQSQQTSTLRVSSIQWLSATVQYWSISASTLVVIRMASGIPGTALISTVGYEVRGLPSNKFLH